MLHLTHAKKRDNGTDSRTAILNAAVVSFGQRGYYGTSLQKIANTVGMTKAGVLHHVGSKEGLLNIVLDEIYDPGTEAIMDHFRMTDRPNVARMWREVVAINAKRPEQVHMFSTLDAEAIDAKHPAHEYFRKRDQNLLEEMLRIPWYVPVGTNIEHLLQAGFSMMDGIQLRWLRAPERDLNEMWAECEAELMPMPMWEGYR
ncbi:MULTISPECIES: TetR/AcrR family transcriptional regulator [unclassified Bifidobacterium]|uniref:TetR/AcrR family transcriptional regulator n=1 Tax=unclassified Bifidobacterium TaxID=2608897 RepID=UPI0023F9C4F4|nr:MULTISPECIES: TetR/AcrR family transcriptional regulator [unclassified Bifidobacterium]WEV66172.1 helix-turn-helix domain containing protein [Bifidobacterium sp. ESL0764]WEV75041.1 helix-turn-helix domain containing protein [Bifidobacterium sp. ESL0800]